jgi:predicted nicotinamide N-methyase
MATAKKEIRAFGVTALLSGHPEVRRLKRSSTPSIHGTKHWPSSWIMMSYLRKHPMERGVHVMEVGAGWGLTGVFCARTFGARVTAVDLDPEVFPYLELHAAINKTHVETLELDFDRLTSRYLKGVDVLIGSDICFWDAMIGQLRRLILRALRAGVGRVLIADPGRSPFESVAGYFVGRGMAELVDWSTRSPRPIHGRILVVDADRFFADYG